MAECAATGAVPDLIAPFLLARFDRFEQVGEKGAASVGH
jgi:sarcosine oxidase subunit beta